MAKDPNIQQIFYGSAIIPRVYTICGVRLLPFCLGHIILLEASNNPLIAQESSPIDINSGLYHFFLALLICSVSYEEGLDLLNDEKKLIELSTLFCKNLHKSMELEDKDWNFFAKITAFKNYMTYHLDMPIYSEEQTSTSDSPTVSGNDWKNSIIITFKGKLGYSSSETLNMSLKKLFTEWTAYAEGEGAIKVLPKDQVDRIAYVQNQRRISKMMEKEDLENKQKEEEI